MANEWSIKNIYYHLVCLVTLFLIVGGFISSAGNVMQLIIPNEPNVPLMSLYYPEHRNNEVTFNPPTRIKLEEMRKQRELQELQYKYYAWRPLLNSLALMIIAIPFYLYHWNRINPKRRRRTGEN
jgi:hypothetical protein